MNGASETARRFVDFLQTNVTEKALTEAGFSDEELPPKSP
jgi:ABC-type molybdate transport system substrate-binding protein